MDTTISRLARGTATSIDRWTAHDWRHGVFLRDLKPHDRVIVRTRNSVYEIIVIVPETASVLVRGGMFFPDFTPARVAGSSLGGGLLKMHGVYTGFHMELLADRCILTTPVQTVSAFTPPVGPVM